MADKKIRTIWLGNGTGALVDMKQDSDQDWYVNTGNTLLKKWQPRFKDVAKECEDYEEIYLIDVRKGKVTDKIVRIYWHDFLTFKPFRAKGNPALTKELHSARVELQRANALIAHYEQLIRDSGNKDLIQAVAHAEHKFWSNFRPPYMFNQEGKK